MIDEQVRSILQNAIYIYLKNHFKIDPLPTGEALNQQIEAATQATLKTALSFLKQSQDTVRMPRDYFQALRDILAGYNGGKLAGVKAALYMNPSNLLIDFETAIQLAETKHAELCDQYMLANVIECDPRILAIAENRVRAQLQLAYMDAKIEFVDAQLAVKMKGDITDLMVMTRKELIKMGPVPCPHILAVLEGYHRAHVEAYEATQKEYKNSVKFYNAIKIGAISTFHADFLTNFDAQAAFKAKPSKVTDETLELLNSPLVEKPLVEQLKTKLESHHRRLLVEKLQAKVKELKGNVKDEGNSSDHEMDYGDRAAVLN